MCGLDGVFDGMFGRGFDRDRDGIFDGEFDGEFDGILGGEFDGVFEVASVSFPSNMLISRCHQSLPPVAATGQCHQLLPTVSATSRCDELVAAGHHRQFMYPTEWSAALGYSMFRSVSNIPAAAVSAPTATAQSQCRQLTAASSAASVSVSHIAGTLCLNPVGAVRSARPRCLVIGCGPIGGIEVARRCRAYF